MDIPFAHRVRPSSQSCCLVTAPCSVFSSSSQCGPRTYAQLHPPNLAYQMPLTPASPGLLYSTNKGLIGYVVDDFIQSPSEKRRVTVME